MTSSNIVQKLLPAPSDVQVNWNYCNVLRDDGMSYGDYPSARLRTGPSTALRTGPSARLRTGVEELTKSRALETDGSEIERDGRWV